MNINTLFGSSLKAEDLPENRLIRVTVEDMSVQTFDDGTKKPLLHFTGKEKGLLLNVTNKNAIVAVLGPETDYWMGKSLVLKRDRTNYGGKMVACVRVDEMATRRANGLDGTPAPAPAPAPQPQYRELGDDDWTAGEPAPRSGHSPDDDVPF